MMEEEKQEEVRQKYMELQILGQQIAQLQKQMQMLESQFIDLALMDQALDDIKNVKEGAKIFVPVGLGIFAKAELKDNKELLVNVGANVAVKKDIPSASRLIKKQLEEIRNVQEETMVELQRLSLHANSLEEEINSRVSESQ